MKIEGWKNRKPIEAIPLLEAVVCEDCHHVTRAKNSRCLTCGSTAIWMVSRVMERSEVDVVVEEVLQLSYLNRLGIR